MTQKVLAASKSPSLCSIIRVDEDIDFVMDRSDLQYSFTVPTEKSIELSRKTYSKRNPIMYSSGVHFAGALKPVTKNNISLNTKDQTSNLMKCTSNAPANKMLRGKRKRNFYLNTSQGGTPKRLRKNDPPNNKMCHQGMGERSTPRLKYKPRKCSSKGQETSPDSDIEILEVKLFKPGTPRMRGNDIKKSPNQLFKPGTSRMKANDMKRTPNQYNNLNFKPGNKVEKLDLIILGKNSPAQPRPRSILKPCFPSNHEVLINEADTAPVMPSNSIIPNKTANLATSEVNPSKSVKWLSANGTIALTHFEKDMPTGDSESQMKYAEKYSLFMPEMKVVRQRKARSRELKCLYDNLNEISWTHEKSFKQLLGTTQYRHSERIIAKNTVGKILRQRKTPALNGQHETPALNGLRKTAALNGQHKTAALNGQRKTAALNVQKPLDKKKASLAKFLALKRTKYGKFKSRFAKPVHNRKKLVLGNKISKNINVKQAPVQKAISSSIAKRQKIVNNSTSKVHKIIKNNSSKTQKIMNNNCSKVQKVMNSSSVKTQKIVGNTNPKTFKVNNMSNKVQKLDNNSNSKALKIINSNNSKTKTSQPKMNVKGKEAPAIKGKSSAFVMKNKAESVTIKVNAEHSEPSCSGTQNNGQWKSETSERITNSALKSAAIKNVIKQLEKIDVTDEIGIFQSIFGADNDIFSAFQRGSKLRVTLEPLEHTDLWNNDFYETFKKHIIEQALVKSIQKKDPDGFHCTFRELEDNLANASNTIKVMKKKKPEEEILRSSVRQSEGAFRYKEIVVKKQQNYMQFVLVPNPSKQNSLTVEAMKELKDAFLLAKRDPNCRAVLLNSSGTYFCTGIDLSQLVGSNKKQLAEEMALTIKDLCLTLSTFTKPVVAAVNGTAVGFGVSLLMYCDVVLASDKATFCIPAARLGYVPEGGLTLTLPQVVGACVASEMLLQGRRLTAEQALRHGLVSEVMWPTQLMNEVIPRMQTIVSQPLQVMEATKSLVRCHLWDKLKSHVEKEWRLLPSLWLSSQCQHNMKRTLQTGWLVD